MPIPLLLALPVAVAAVGAAAYQLGLIPPLAMLELRHKLPSYKIENARTIAREFKAAGHSDAVTAAAIANAWAESLLDHRAVGDNGHAIGLFQLNSASRSAAGYGMSQEERKDPVINTRRILEDHGMAAVLASYRRGATVAELAADFGEFVERPWWSQSGKPERERDRATIARGRTQRADRARQLFGDAADRSGLVVELGASLLPEDPST